MSRKKNSFLKLVLTNIYRSFKLFFSQCYLNISLLNIIKPHTRFDCILTLHVYNKDYDINVKYIYIDKTKSFQ
jgi:hypothetical protein